MNRKRGKSIASLLLVFALVVTLCPVVAPVPVEAASGNDFVVKAISDAENGAAIDYACTDQTLYITDAGLESMAEYSDDFMTGYLEGEEPQVQWFREKGGNATEIAGATGRVYNKVSLADDSGAKLYAKVTYGGDSIKTAKVQVVSDSERLELTSGKPVRVHFTSKGYNSQQNHYWKINIPVNSKVTVKLDADYTGTFEPYVTGRLAGSSGYAAFRASANESDTCFIEKGGDYYVDFDGRSNAEGTYTLTITVAPINWGTVTISGLDNLVAGTYENTKFKIKLTGADSEVNLDRWSSNNDYSTNNYDSNLSGKSATGYLTTSSTDAGHYKLEVRLDNELTSDLTKTVIFDLVVKPKKITNYDLSDLEVGYNSVKFTLPFGDGAGTYGSKIQIQRYKSGKWTTVKTVKDGTKSTTLTGLSSNTSYKYRLVGYVPASNGKKSISGAPSKTLSVKTGYSSKPQVKSIKCYDAKQKYVKRVYHPGHWTTTGKWQNGYYTGGYYVTNFKVKVTLKKKMTGQKGLIIYNELLDSKKVSGTGTTFTTTMSVDGKKKGKTISLKIKGYRNGSYLGYSKYTTKKVKIK